MNLLSTIIERLNQRVEAGNIFDQIYGLCELSADGNDKAWIHYIGNGQAIPVTNFDAKQGTIFWAKRGKISVSKNESLKLAGCKALYETKFSLSAYAVVRKDHLPCDSADAQDWIASRVLRLVSGTDPQFKTAIGVVAYEVVPNGYINEIKSLTANYEWACVSIDIDVNVLTSSEDGCYDTCATGDIPLPDFEPCTPCLTEVAVDGVTITGNGTVSDPLVAIGGGGGGGSLRVQDEGTTVTNAATTLNFTGNVTASLASAGNVTVNVPAETPQVNADWNASSGVAQILNKPTLATVATSGSYTDLINQPSIPPAQVNSDWNAVSGVAEILNKPSIPAAQIQSDWNQANNAALDFIKNKPTIPSTSGLVPYTGATTNVDLGTHTLSAKDLVISHPSGSGVAASITKGGSGEALTVVKSSGSGNAASITGGVTLIDELHLTTDLADSYIASAATWNAKFNTPSGTTAQYVRGDGSLATFPSLPITYINTNDQTAVTGTTANTRVASQLIPANTVATGKTIEVKARVGKTGTAGLVTIRVYANTADSISSPAPTLLMTSATTANAQNYNGIDRIAVVKSATQTNTPTTTTSIQNDALIGNAPLVNSNIDWTVDQYIIFAVQNGASGDSSLFSYFKIEIK
jgi:hypothetical protein